MQPQAVEATPDFGKVGGAEGSRPGVPFSLNDNRHNLGSIHAGAVGLSRAVFRLILGSYANLHQKQSATLPFLLYLLR
jgi:hypothetical protein